MGSMQSVDMMAAMRRLAERRIEEAMREGKFDNLSGRGKPLDLEPMPAEENARMTWWAVRILKQNDVVPDEVRWRKSVDLLKVKIWQLRSEQGLDALVKQVNDLVKKINTLGTNALKGDMSPLDLDAERSRLRERLAARGGADEISNG